MRALIIGLMAFTLAAPAQAQEPPKARAVLGGYNAGFKDCARALERFVVFVHEEDDDYGFLSTWSTARPNDEMMTAITAETFTDGHGIATFAAVKSAAGTCDVTLTQTITLPELPCGKAREDAFKAWKPVTELEGLQVYEDPTDANTTATLIPVGQIGCVIVKHILALGVAN
jgi:hypothetical protein